MIGFFTLSLLNLVRFCYFLFDRVTRLLDALLHFQKVLRPRNEDSQIYAAPAAWLDVLVNFNAAFVMLVPVAISLS